MQIVAMVMDALAEFAEAEGRALRASVLATVRATAWIALAAVLAAAGFGFLLYGVYLEASRLASPGIGAFAAAGAACVIALLAAVIARRQVRRRPAGPQPGAWPP